MGFNKQKIKIRQQLVTEFDVLFANHLHDRPIRPRLLRLRPDVGVIAEKGGESRHLGPTREQFARGIIQKATDVGPAEWDTAEAKDEQHLNRITEVFPNRAVVSRPYQGLALHSGIAGTADDEGPLMWLISQSGFGRSPRHLNRIHIMSSRMME